MVEMNLISEMSVAIEFRNVSKVYCLDDGRRVDALKNLNFSLQPGRMLGVIGSNGTGKTTMLHLAAGLAEPTSGEIVRSPPANRRVGLIWQDYRASLLPWRSVLGNLLFPFELGKEIDLSDARTRACQLLEQYLPDVKLNQRLDELSGGQQQMISLIRCALQKPDLYLYDEPYSAIDQFRRWAWLKNSEKLRLESKASGIFVSHDLDEAILVADRLLIFDKRGGTLEIENTTPRPRTIEHLDDPLHLECRSRALRFMNSA